MGKTPAGQREVHTIVVPGPSVSASAWGMGSNPG